MPLHVADAPDGLDLRAAGTKLVEVLEFALLQQVLVATVAGELVSHKSVELIVRVNGVNKISKVNCTYCHCASSAKPEQLCQILKGTVHPKLDILLLLLYN